VARCRERALLLAADEDVIQLFPAVNVDRHIAERAMSILANAI
jgi:hypothetical protein